MQCERTMVKHKAGDGEGDCCRGHCSTGAAESESSNGRQGGRVRQRWGQTAGEYTDARQAQAVWLAQTMQEGHAH